MIIELFSLKLWFQKKLVLHFKISLVNFKIIVVDLKKFEIQVFG